MDVSDEAGRRHISDQPLLDKPPRALDCGVISMLEYARNAELWAIGGRFDQQVGVIEARGDRLLAQDMLTGPDSVEDDLGMCGCRGADTYGVDIRACKQLVIVGESGIGTSLSSQGLGSRRVDVGNRSQGRSRVGAEVRRCMRI
jgi:hypothetical protein